MEELWYREGTQIQGKNSQSHKSIEQPQLDSTKILTSSKQDENLFKSPGISTDPPNPVQTLKMEKLTLNNTEESPSAHNSARDPDPSSTSTKLQKIASAVYDHNEENSGSPRSGLNNTAKEFNLKIDTAVVDQKSKKEVSMN